MNKYFIYWHGKILREYNNYSDFVDGKTFFEGFLLKEKLEYKTN
jgi:hypothetical protein